MRVLRQQLQAARRAFDPGSLRVRLTLGIVAVVALGLGGVAGWMGWQMQQLLVATRKENVRYIADRLASDVAAYSEFAAPTEAMQKAVARNSSDGLLVWLERPNGQIAARSDAAGPSVPTLTQLAQQTSSQRRSRIARIEGQYWLLCAVPLQANESSLGRAYVAQNIHQEYAMFLGLSATWAWRAWLPLQSRSRLLPGTCAARCGRCSA